LIQFSKHNSLFHSYQDQLEGYRETWGA